MDRHRWRGVHFSDEEISEIAKELELFVDKCLEKGDCPTLAGFCAESRLNRANVYLWLKRKHVDLVAAKDYLDAQQENSLIQETLKNNWNASVGKLMLSSNHGYTERNTLQGDSENPLGINYKHDPAKAAEEIIAAQNTQKDGDEDE